MSVLKTVTLLANAMIHSETGLIEFANDEPVVRVLVLASSGLSAPKSETKQKRVKQTNQREVFCLFFYSQLTEHKD